MSRHIRDMMGVTLMGLTGIVKSVHENANQACSHTKGGSGSYTRAGRWVSPLLMHPVDWR